MQSPVAYAIYSPTLSDEVSVMTKHIVKARQTNGVKSFSDAYADAKKANEGFLSKYMTSIKEVIIKQLTNSYLDDISLLIGRWINKKENITNCLRDDIWALKATQEQIVSELLKAVLLNDSTNSSILWEDYQKLNMFIMGGTATIGGVQMSDKGLKETYRNTTRWFPKEKNYYIDCPFGDFDLAIKKLKASFENLKATFEKDGTQELGSFASMKTVAKQRAIRKAKKWIAENKITLTLGGKKGSNPTSLFNGPGLKGLVSDIETELVTVRKYGEAIYDSVRKSIAPDDESVDYETYVKAYNAAQEAKTLAVNQMENTIIYNLSLNNVSENSLIEIEQILVKINDSIEQAYSDKGDKNNLKSFCDQLNALAKKQCKNHAPISMPSCSQ